MPNTITFWASSKKYGVTDMVLTIYDISGIQSYVFATSKLKETAGASIIISRALEENIPTLFKVKKDAWEKEEFTFCNGDKHKIVYIGGGNALVAYDCEETEQKCTRKLAQCIFEEAGDALKLYSASVTTGENCNLSQTSKDLYNALAKNKRTTPNTQTAKGFSINAHHNETFEPILLDEKTGECVAKSVMLKQQAFNSGDSSFKIEDEDIRFTVDFEK
jgi:hypothetical protein